MAEPHTGIAVTGSSDDSSASGTDNSQGPEDQHTDSPTQELLREFNHFRNEYRLLMKSIPERASSTGFTNEAGRSKPG